MILPDQVWFVITSYSIHYTKLYEEEIERQILKELKEEILQLKKQGKLCKFETAIYHAMEKVKKALKEVSKEAIEEASKEDGVKKTVKNAEDQQE